MNRDLIFDVGLHTGDDTVYYLHRGFRVVAVEANPLYVKRAQERFAAEIKAGRLVVEPVGIGAQKGRAAFWLNDIHDDWNSFNEDFATHYRDPQYLPHCHTIEVNVIPFSDLLAKHGVPFYLKSDIEGHDIYCLRALDRSDLPTYISVESHRLAYLERLYELGYRQFKWINQAGGHAPRNGWVFPPGSSGPFGDDTPGDWLTFDDVAYAWSRVDRGEVETTPDFPLAAHAWCDWHAKL